MLIDIEKVKVGDCIRKDMGDLKELSDDIAKNGLINPPVVTPDFELIAGERRLEAMKKLGYKQVEVRVMKVEDAEHKLNLEINENENRKDFNKSERIEYARQLERIERVKASQREKAGVAIDPSQNSDRGRTDDIVAEKLGIGSRDTYRKEKYIADNADPETLEQWNKEEISTHKAYTKVKELEKQLEETENELEIAKAGLEFKDRQIEKYSTESSRLSAELELAKRNKAEPQIIEKEVIKEVIPEDYHLNKKQIKELEEVIEKQKSQIERQKNNNAILRAQEQETRKTLESEKLIKEKIDKISIMTVKITDFIDEVGGLLYISEYVDLMPLEYRKVFLKAVTHLRDFSCQLYFNLEDEIKKHIGE
jgi:ParB family chromosome partitioning protein